MEAGQLTTMASAAASPSSGRRPPRTGQLVGAASPRVPRAPVRAPGRAGCVGRQIDPLTSLLSFIIDRRPRRWALSLTGTMDASPPTVAEGLRSAAARIATLDALEALAPPIPSAVALAAAPALVDVMNTETQRASFDRCGLLLARLCAEALPDPTVHAAAVFGEQLAAIIAPAIIAEAVQRASSGGQPLTVEDARSYACLWARDGPAYVRGATVPWAAAGYTAMEFMGIVSFLAHRPSASHSSCLALTPCSLSVGAQWMSVEPIVSQQKTPSDDVPRQILTPLVELLRSGELPELAIGAAWRGIENCLTGRLCLGPAAMELGLIDLAAEHCRAIGSAADMVSISRGKAGRARRVIIPVWNMTSFFAGQAERPDLAAIVASGLFDICIEIVVAFAAAGVDGLRDTDYIAVWCALMVIVSLGSQPGCEGKIRGAGSALAFCLENSLDMVEAMGMTTGSVAASLCCSVFGRDEGGSEFTFQQQHVDTLTTLWSQIVRAVGYYVTMKPSADSISALELSISDKNKPLLLANKEFVPYLVDSLLLDPDHPRAGMEEEHKIWCQEHHVECLAQLAVFEPAREALLQDSYEEHVEQTERLVAALSFEGIKLNASKVHMFCSYVRYLVCIVGNEELHMDPLKVKVIDDMASPVDILGVRQFLGSCSFYRNFIPGFAEICSPLTDLARRSHGLRGHVLEESGSDSGLGGGAVRSNGRAILPRLGVPTRDACGHCQRPRHPLRYRLRSCGDAPPWRVRPGRRAVGRNSRSPQVGPGTPC